jgi:N-acetylglucosamine kinase-like BadF-type ATPase
MSARASVPGDSYFLGFDGGGAKTDCVLADAQGQIVARSKTGPSNPLRTGYTRAWFALSEAADSVLSRQKIKAGHIRGICAGLGGAGRSGVARRVTSFFERGYPNAQVRVVTDLEIALDAAFSEGEGMILLAGTGSAAFGRDAAGRTARAGGRGPWFSDEGSAYDIGRRAFAAVERAEEDRGPATALTTRAFSWHHCHDWNGLMDRVIKNPDDVLPQTFPLVAQLADKGDAVACEILSTAAASLAELAGCVANELGWRDREAAIAKAGGMYGRSKFFDAAIESEVKKVAPRARLISLPISPAAAAAREAVRLTNAKGNAA